MNTADRSVGHIDYAIRRRFSFVPVSPKEEAISQPKAKELFKKVQRIFNEYTAPDFNKADVALTGGASYTFDNGFSINAGYDHGLSRLDKNSSFKSYNRTFKVGVGFRF